jgi:hypothetical protein
MPPAIATGTAINAVRPSVSSERMGEHMGPEGSLFADFDAGHDFDFFLLLRLILGRQNPHSSRKQPGKRTDDEQKTEKARHFRLSVPW